MVAAAAARFPLPLVRVAFPTVEGVAVTLPELSASAARARAAFCRAVRGLTFCAEALVTLFAEAVAAAVRLFATEGVEAVFRLAGAIALAPAPEADCGFVVALVVVLAVACFVVDAAVGLVIGSFLTAVVVGCLRIDFGFVIVDVGFVFVAALLLPKRVDAGPLSPSSESESTSPSK